jgi:mevalonate kinase
MNLAAKVARGQGKVILLGEHSVVYGKPAIAAGIASGCHASAESASGFSLEVQPWGVRVALDTPESDPQRELLRRAFGEICARYGAPLAVRAVMEIPGGAGLGGSAALSVAVLRAMDTHAGLVSDPEATIAASLAWERVYHGNPSGIDSALAVHGGLALYRRGEPLVTIRARNAVYFVVGNSAEHGSTKDMVASVARQHASYRDKTERIFDAIEALVINAKSALETGDLRSLGQLMDHNQRLLNGLMLSTTKLEEMCQLACAAGALGAKLTGGGGGGCMIALAPDRERAQPIAAALGAAGYANFVMEVS